MIIHNLTDRNVPYNQTRTPRKLRLRGKVIEPGQSVEFKDNVPLSEFAGWITSNMVSVDSLPPWYQEARAAEQDAKNSSMAEKKAAATAKATKEFESVEEIEPVIEVAIDEDNDSTQQVSSKRRSKRG